VSRLRLPLDPFLRATSVAVIGGSRDPSTVGGSVLANLRSSGFSGHLTVVNAELEINSLVASPAGVMAVDARARV